jgi:hypothetical protein
MRVKTARLLALGGLLRLLGRFLGLLRHVPITSFLGDAQIVLSRGTASMIFCACAKDFA